MTRPLSGVGARLYRRRRARPRIRAWLAQAQALERAGAIEAAGARLESILAIDPAEPAALHGLGQVRYRQGRVAEALALLERALAAAPRNAVCASDLGNVLCAAGDPDRARDAYGRALAIDPGQVDARFNLAILLADAFDPADALAEVLAVLRLAPDDVHALEALGKVQLRLRDRQAAGAAFERALALDPASAEALCGLGEVAIARGELAAARRHFEAALAHAPRHGHAMARALRLGADVSVGRLEAALAAGPDGESACALHFALGEALGSEGRADAAFDHFSAANERMRAAYPFDGEAPPRMVDRIIEQFPADVFAGASRDHPRASSELPILIVGVPRSGTSLVEQIIASHPAAAGAGEAPFMAEAVRALMARAGEDFPECITALDRAMGARLSSRYLDALRRIDAAAQRITDKSISGAFHLGLAALLLPKARVVWCRRDPLDAGLSIYCSRFAPGAVPFGSDLHAIGRFIGAHERLMTHWLEALPLAVHAVHYEALVADPAGASRALIEACGLPWDDACLSFFRTRRDVFTASALQVRRPVYRHSVGRAVAYRHRLGDLERGLAGN